MNKMEKPYYIDRQLLSEDNNLIKYRFCLGDKFGVGYRIHFVLHVIESYFGKDF